MRQSSWQAPRLQAVRSVSTSQVPVQVVVTEEASEGAEEEAVADLVVEALAEAEEEEAEAEEEEEAEVDPVVAASVVELVGVSDLEALLLAKARRYILKFALSHG